MTNGKASIIGVVACAGILMGPGMAGASSQGAEPVLDVNDVSFLWPAPEGKEAVKALVSADEMNADGTSELWPRKAFNTTIKTAESVTVEPPVGRKRSIDFSSLKDQHKQLATWKVAGVRVDPSAPSCDPKVIAIFKETPQIRLVLQPVTVTNTGAVEVHDFSAHVVYSFDKDKFGEIVDDLKALKQAAPVQTNGPLGVHPGLKAKDPRFAYDLKTFLKKHLSEPRLTAVAFMGVDGDSWIFFAMIKQEEGKFGLYNHPTLGEKTAQMRIIGGVNVFPVPATTNVDQGKGMGVSTSMLFEKSRLFKIDRSKLELPALVDLDRPLYEEIPDLVANPRRAHFFNTDCISCHTESNLRKDWNIAGGDGRFRYSTPTGISGVEPSALPQHVWNVRNFGWFAPPTIGGTATATATMRTANEAAESADFLNRKYLGQGR